VPWPELLTLVELLSTTIVRKIPRNGSISQQGEPSSLTACRLP
jgi:hypothetical protein